MSRRHFGTVRRRSSGRWQAVYRVEGRMYSAGMYTTKTDALAQLSTIEADLRRGAWIDPRPGDMTLRTYAEGWLEERSDLAFRTKELCAYLIEHHILPALGSARLSGLASSKIRSWHATLSKVHPSTAAKAYRLLSATLRTAVTDGFIISSPCKVAGGGAERPTERPFATIREVEGLESAMPEHLRLIGSRSLGRTNSYSGGSLASRLPQMSCKPPGSALEPKWDVRICVSMTFVTPD
jgi:hypothetical protein